MLFPLGDDNSKIEKFPFVTCAFIAINILVFIYQMMILFEPRGAVQLNQFIYAYAVVPKEVTSGQDLPPLIAPFPIYTTLITSMFMHGGLLHIAGNMLYLWIFGDNVEDAMGSLRYLIFYLLCGLIATLAHIVTDSDSKIPSLGASGAIAGVLGAYLVLFPYQKVKVWMGLLFGIIQLPAMLVIGLWAVLQFINGYGSLKVETAQTGGVAYWAHIGGFVAGMALVWLFRKPRKRDGRVRAGIY
jgi:membrane associated rhomboid family serine protease